MFVALFDFQMRRINPKLGVKNKNYKFFEIQYLNFQKSHEAPLN